MKRYSHDPATPTHLRKLVDSARGDDLEIRRRRRVAERLGLLLPPVASGEPAMPSVNNPKSWVSAKGLALTAVVLFGGGSYATFSSSRPPPPPSSSPSFVSPMAPPSAEPDVAPAAKTPSAPAPSAPATSMAAIAIDALPDRPIEPLGRSARAMVSAETAKVGNDTARSGRGELGSPSTSSSNEDLRLEIAALDAVRRATESGRPREALGLLAGYATKFPAGKLREEALVLRIEALHASGERTRAAHLAQRLLQDSPNTPYAARVRAALESDSRE